MKQRGNLDIISSEGFKMENEEINAGDIEDILISLDYSKRYIENVDMQIMPYEIKKEKRERIEQIIVNCGI